jgi:hypothetical protein
MMMNRSALVGDAQRFEDYARERLTLALEGIDSGVEVLSEIQTALMALHVCYGSEGTITLTPADILEYVDPRREPCICPSDLVARGGFRSGCSAEHIWGVGDSGE